ncbi:major tail protein [Arthrobacter phage Noely]|uniref:Major tail protein n=1 Tax=Arthrobacter phage Noely TaxID=2419964 RepID=A0A3G2KAK3_9CAUD|nr:major tail protein [Arthrobacter phage Noely]AYN55949.1 major tail protein [Arthrobacter phage Noely]
MSHSQLEIKNALVKAAVVTDGVAGELIDFADAIDNVKLQTTYTVSKFAAVSGKSSLKATPPKDALVLNLGDSLQDGELWAFLRKNHGKPGQVEFTPEGGAAGAKITATVLLVAPGSVGGAEGANASTVTLECDGPADITYLAAA